MAVAITATSTYAWFVVNKEVTASNMQVTVKSDTTYLVISNSSTLATSTSLALTAANPKDVLPVRYNTAATPESGYTKWETSSGAGYDSGTATGGYHAVASANLSNYIVTYTFYVGLTPTTSQDATNLKIKDLTVTNTAASDPDNTFMDAVSVMVECFDMATESASIGIVNCTNTETSGGLNVLTQSQCEGLGTLTSSVTRNHVYKIVASVYINGDNAVVKSSNASHIASFAVEMQLEVTPGS